jgi:hypothetical protein
MPKPLSAARRGEIAEAFKSAVNMTAAELQAWLETDESLSVGFMARGAAESVGHRSGRRIVGLLGRHPAELEEDDYAHMRKVAGFVARHSAQRPAGEVSKTRWRYSLMNWGHDPLKG